MSLPSAVASGAFGYVKRV